MGKVWKQYVPLPGGVACDYVVRCILHSLRGSSEE